MRTSYANVASTLALVLALGGTGAYAAGKVTGKDIKNSSVTGKDVKDGSLAGGDVEDGSLTGSDVKPGSVGADRLSAQVNAAIAAVPPAHATPIDATVPDKGRTVHQPIGQVSGLPLTVECGTSPVGEAVEGVDLSVSTGSGESLSHLEIWGVGILRTERALLAQRSDQRAPPAGFGGTALWLQGHSGPGRSSSVGAAVPLSGEVAVSYDFTTQSCRVSGWILHG